MTVRLIPGDCLEEIPRLVAEGIVVDSIVTDPPYGLEFMGKEWDKLDGGLQQENVWKGRRGKGGSSIGSDDRTPGSRHHIGLGITRAGFKRCTICGKRAFSGSPCRCDSPAWVVEYSKGPPSSAIRAQRWHDQWANKAYEILKPGGYLLAFGGTRTHHRIWSAIEDAGFVIQDTIMWLYGCLSEDTEILTETGWKFGADVNIGERVAAWDSTSGKIKIQTVEDKTVAPWSGELVRFVNDDTDQLLTPNHRVYHQPMARVQTLGVRRASYGSVWKVSEASAINRWNSIKLPCAGEHDGPGIGGEDYAALLGWVWTEGSFDKSWSGVRIYQSSTANPAKTAEIDWRIGMLCPTSKRYTRERTYIHGSTVRKYEEVCWYFSGDLANKMRRDLPDKSPCWPLLWKMTLAEKRAFYHAAMRGDGSGNEFYQKSEADLIWFQALLTTIGMRGKIAMRKPPRDGGAVCVTPRATTEMQHRHLQKTAEMYSGNVWCVKVATGAFVARRKGKVFITGNSGFPKGRTQLKPSFEPICVAYKPGGKRELQIDECRIGTGLRINPPCALKDANIALGGGWRVDAEPKECIGRWPANVCHSGDDEVMEAFAAFGEKPGCVGPASLSTNPGNAVVFKTPRSQGPLHPDTGTAARFFFCGKADGQDRWGSKHPTVKPVELISWLVKLVTPPQGTVLDPPAAARWQ